MQIWRLLQLNKSDQIESILGIGKNTEHQQVAVGFLGIMETASNCWDRADVRTPILFSIGWTLNGCT